MTIIVAVDGDDAPNHTLEVGYELARDADEELVVMHVMPQEAYEEFKNATSDGDGVRVADGNRYGGQSGESHVGRSSGSKHTYTVEDGERNAAKIAQRALEGTYDEWQDVSIQGRVGDPVKEILAEADRRDARYLVIGGRKRTPVGKAMFGSTTQSILLNATLPVMTVMGED